MRKQQSIVLAVLVGLTASIPSQASAQFAVGARASTLGFGVEGSYRLNKMLSVRVGGNYFQLSRDATVEDIDYTISPHLANGTAMLDLYPVGGAFHLTGGFLLNHNELRMTARLNQNVDIGGTTYTPQQVGSLLGTVSFKKGAPYLGIGFGGRGKFAILFDLGVGFTGTPLVDLTGTTTLTGNAKTEFDANVAEEEAQVRSEIAGKSFLKYHPVLSLGFRIGF